MIAGQQVPSTLYFLRSLARLIRQSPTKVEEAVESVLREGEVKIYQRAVRVRGERYEMGAVILSEVSERRNSLSPTPTKQSSFSLHVKSRESEFSRENWRALTTR